MTRRDPPRSHPPSISSAARARIPTARCARTKSAIGATCLQELPRRIHEWMPRLAEEGVVGADAIFACLGPALEIFSRYSRVEKASGEAVTLKEYLEQVWAAVAKEALTMIFPDADTSGFEADARLTAMWLWTLNAGNTDAANGESADEEEADDESEGGAKKAKTTGFVLEYDAARKIAQGLGAHLEDLGSLVEVSGRHRPRLLPVGERARHLFGKDEGHVAPHKKKRRFRSSTCSQSWNKRTERKRRSAKRKSSARARPSSTASTRA